MKKELEAIKKQLEYALEELQKCRSNKQLLHDWISDPLHRVKNLIKECDEYEQKISEVAVCRNCGKPKSEHSKASLMCLDRFKHFVSNWLFLISINL